MVQTSGSVASLLSQVYQDKTASLNSSLSKIASGKRVQNASDDFTAFIKSSTHSGYMTQYQTFSRDLQVGKAKVDYMTAVGNSVMDTLQKMKDVANAYNSTTDLNEQAALNSKYVALLATFNATVANSKYDGITALYSNVATSNITTTIGSSAYNISINAEYVANNAVVAIGTLNAGTAAALDTEIANGSNFLVKTSTLADRISSQIKLNTSIISSFQTSISALTDVNEAEEMTNITNMQVRQQAGAAMMAQANSSAAVLARLFQ